MQLKARGRLDRPFRRLIAVTRGPNPSYDYYLAPRLGADGPPVTVVDLHDDPGLLAPELFDDALVLFCRYVSTPWLRMVERRRDSIAGTMLFLDDDLAALVRDWTVPPLLRALYYLSGLRHWRRLSRILDVLVVSTPALSVRFPDAAPLVIAPMAGDADLPDAAPRDGAVIFGFHATPTHRGEADWLVPVIRQVLQTDPGVKFELVERPRGMGRLRSQVRILPFRPWPEYRIATAAGGPDVLLAPLVPRPANSARAGVKRIDAARCGAALLVSNARIYRPSPEEEELGMLLPLAPDEWAEMILLLSRDRGRVSRLAALNRRHVMQARSNHAPLFTPVDGGWGLA